MGVRPWKGSAPGHTHSSSSIGRCQRWTASPASPCADQRWRARSIVTSVPDRELSMDTDLRSDLKFLSSAASGSVVRPVSRRRRGSEPGYRQEEPGPGAEREAKTYRIAEERVEEREKAGSGSAPQRSAARPLALRPSRLGLWDVASEHRTRSPGLEDSAPVLRSWIASSPVFCPAPLTRFQGWGVSRDMGPQGEAP